MFKKLFEIYNKYLYWKVDFTVTNQLGTGVASLILKTNILPMYGICTIDKTNGLSLITEFKINCYNWDDPDGHIVKYEFMGIYDHILVIKLYLFIFF